KFSKIFHNCLTMLYSLTRLLEYLNKTDSFNYLNIKTFSLFLIPNSGYYKLQKIGITTLVDLDHHVQITTALTLTAKDIQIAISFSGKRKNICEAAAIAKQQGAKVIAIVGNKQQTPLVQLADYVLESIAGENEWRSSSISSRAAQNTLTDLLFLALLQKREVKARSLIINARLMINKLDE
ncbi:SIS domain-containing protein, partial [Arsenophonus sp.]|uniref:SIS domain-containing protein n=1 Tax=Arsenophonus sp. TaxID=1872640 RepID=UPI00387A7D43